ncbi:MAG: endonuclease MutS2 [Clostridium chrysemydis]|uniref:endonuclease MutS2 n=1 Tax=Clostridium chrysemydis TaxID=2665504 RepID=UPI003F343A22
MNKETLNKLHYYELKEIVKGYCVSGLGKELVEKIKPSSDLKVVDRRLEETEEGRALIDASYYIPFDGIFNIKPLLEKMEKGSSLDIEDLVMISNFLRGSRKIKNFMKDKEGYAKTLSLYADNITELSYIEEEINNTIIGNSISSNASKELKKIRRHKDICEGKIKERLEKFLKSPNNKEAIGEFFISLRNGRYTVPIKAAYKNKVDGTIIETSSKGGSVFIEPKVISKYTSEFEVLKVEEAMEEYKILAKLTEIIYERVKELKINIEVIAEYDMIFAKAKFSKEINGIKPKLNKDGFIKIVKGRYPLIKDSVPLDFEIGDSYKSLIITGPNAGGKTVVLKTIGILTLATLSGFHIGASKNTEISVFDNVFVDIGDNQSIENALSTFSSHVSNLSKIIKETNKNTLLLFDEIGSGTEPNEGASLAIAILEELYLKGATTVATTHYGEIKNYSSLHPHFENAAMEFQKDTLDPLYKLKIGVSGDSNALYISKKVGIPDSIIEKTKKYIKTKEYEINLISIEKPKNKVVERERNNIDDFNIGDKVLLLDKNESGIVFKERDNLNNVIVFFKEEYLKVNYSRLKLQIKASDLYQKDYDFNQLFVSFEERKLEKDILRGSKKALKKIRKEHLK